MFQLPVHNSLSPDIRDGTEINGPKMICVCFVILFVCVPHKLNVNIEYAVSLMMSYHVAKPFCHFQIRAKLKSLSEECLCGAGAYINVEFQCLKILLGRVGPFEECFLLMVEGGPTIRDDSLGASLVFGNVCVGFKTYD
jgi:hypothetical protein